MNLKLNAVMPTSAQIHSGFTESCSLKVLTGIAESCTWLLFKTRNEKVHDNVALYTYWVDSIILFFYRPIDQGIGVNSGGGGDMRPLL